MAVATIKVAGNTTEAVAALEKLGIKATATAKESEAAFAGLAEKTGVMFGEMGAAAEKFGITSGAAMAKAGAGMEAASKKGGMLHQQMGMIGALAATAAVGGVMEFAHKSIDKFKEVGGEVLKLQRDMGGTAEAASRMRVAAQESGIGFDTFDGGVRKLSKSLETAASTAKGLGKMTHDLGFAFTDAHGKVLPTDQLILKLSDKFKNMPNGPEKTAEAMKLFGKSGADMLPMLNRGSEALKEFMKESDATGNTLSGKQLDSIKKSAAEHRKFNLEVEGLQVAFGEKLLPMVNQVVAFLDGKIIPAIGKASEFYDHHKGIINQVAIVLGTLVVGIKALTIAQAALNVVMDANPIGLIVVAIAALAAGVIYAYTHSKTFRDIVQTAFKDVRDAAEALWAKVSPVVMSIGHWLGEVLPPIVKLLGAYFKAEWTAISTVVRWAWDTFSPVFEWISEKVGKALGEDIQAAKVVWDNVWNGIKDTVQSVWSFLKPIFDNISSAVSTITGGIGKVAGLIGSGVSSELKGISGLLADGGPVAAGEMYLVGEQGPELFVSNSAGAIIPNSAISGGSSHAAVSPAAQVHQSQVGRRDDNYDLARAIADVLAQTPLTLRASGQPLRIV